MKHKPISWQLASSKLFFSLFGKQVYKDFAERLPLEGQEQVLGFGYHSERVAIFAEKRLTQGQLTCAIKGKRNLSVYGKTLRHYSNISVLPDSRASLSFAEESFELIYCYFVWYELSEEELTRVVTALAKSLKPKGALVFCEPLQITKNLELIKKLTEQNGLVCRHSRISDVPFLGNTLENRYIKQ